MTSDIAIVLALALAVPAGIAATIRHSVRRMLSSPAAKEEPAAAPAILASVPEHFRAFLDLEGFRFTKAYSFHNTKFGIWTRISAEPPLRLFWAFSLLGRTGGEFTTAFSDEISLTTTTTREAFLFPRPFGKFVQSFPKASPEVLWQAHLEGEKYLRSKLSIETHECRLPFLDRFQRGMVQELSYVTSIRLWFLRGVYWYIANRFLSQNRPIWQQDVPRLYGKVA